MSNHIVLVRRNAETILGECLGKKFKALPFQFNVEQNDERSLASGFSVVWGRGNQVYVIDQKVNIEQELEITIAKAVYVGQNDDKLVDTLEDIYGPIGTVLKRFCNDKLDLRALVQKIECTSIEAPELIGNGRNTVAVKMTFRVRYLVI